MRSADFVGVALALVLGQGCARSEAAVDELELPSAALAVPVAAPTPSPTCALPIDTSQLIDAERDITAVNALLASLCACTSADPKPVHELELDIGHNAQTLVLHRFAGGATARACFFDALDQQLPARRFRTRARIGPTELGLKKMIGGNGEAPPTELARLNQYAAGLTACTEESVERNTDTGCQFQLDFVVESLAHRSLNTMTTGMWVADQQGRECLARKASGYRPPDPWRVHWSILPLGQHC